MEFQFTAQEEAFRTELQDFLARELPSDWSSTELDDRDEETWKFTLEMRRKLAARGWLTMAWPKEYGGQDASPMLQLIFEETLAYHRAPGRDIFGLRMLAPTLMLYGTDEQKRKYLPPIARGEVQWCQGYSEPEAGSDLASLATSAVADGDDFVVNGTKIWTSLAHRADHIMLLARTDPDAPKHRGISFLLADMTAPGVEVKPIENLAGHHHFNMITFEEVRVPRENLVGELNRGWYVGATLLDFERSAVEYSADARRTIHDLVRFWKETGRRDRAVDNDALVRRKLADLAIRAEVSRLVSYRVASMQSSGELPNKEASMAKLLGTELQQRVAKEGMSILGLYGQLAPGSRYAPLQGRIEEAALLSTSATIAAGTSEIQRGIIATRGLGLPRG